MSLGVVDLRPAALAVSLTAESRTAAVEDALPDLVAQATGLLERAASADVRSLHDEPLGAVVAALAGLESRVAALRLGLSAEADRRQVARQTADTGTDAWVARLTGSTREQAASGLRIARLLEGKYTVARAAFAAGRVRPEHVRVIVNAAEQAPAEATPEQIRQAEEWLVGKATG